MPNSDSAVIRLDWNIRLANFQTASEALKSSRKAKVLEVSSKPI
jgi:hypothetical protein